MTKSTQHKHLTYLSGGLARLIKQRGHVPSLPPRLIGRDKERDQIGQRLSNGGRVLLWGRPGTGKHALAATVCSDWLADERGPILWLDMGQLDYPTLLAGVRRSLASDAKANPATIVRAGAIRLVVMAGVDNLAAQQAMQAGLPDNLPVLISSNQPPALEPAYQINFLHVRDAMQLLGLYARQRFGDGLEEHTLLARLKFHTLGLAIAGQTMRSTGLSAGQLVERIDDLAGTEASLEKLFGAIMEMLSGQAKVIFNRLGALLTPYTPLDLLALALQGQTAEVRAGIDELAAHGLARWEDLPDGQRMIALHHLVFLYAAQPRPGYNDDKDVMSAIERACNIYAKQHEHSAGGVLAQAKLRTLHGK